MTVLTSNRTAGPFAGDGAAMSFPFLFRVISEDDVRVVRIASDGTREVLAKGLQYSVDLISNQADSPGGTVRTTAPLPHGYTLEIRRTVATIQPLDLQNRGGFYPEAIEEQLDREVIAIQQIEEQLDATLRVPDLTGVPELPGPEARRGTLLGFDQATGAPRLYLLDAVGGGSGSPAPSPSPTPSPAPAPATDTVLMNGLIAAALVAAATAANRTGDTVKDLTAPPFPTGLTAAAGVVQATLTWTPATYTVGHGPGRVVVYAANWVGGFAPAASAAVSLGGVLEPVGSARMYVDPGQKVRFWIAFETADGVESTKSAPVDVELPLLTRSMIGPLLIEAQDISNSLELGRLANDPTFAGGAASWNGFQQRVPATSSSAPAGCPVSFCAEFKGRDCVSNKPLSVDPDDTYRLSIWANAMGTGLQVGLTIYEDYADGRPTSAKVVTLTTPPANTWARLSGSAKPDPGANRWRIGPLINQPHGGTKSCWFAGIRADLMIDSNLIVNGAVVAASMATSAFEAVDAKIANLQVDAAQITGTLTASQIDARGLSIKDENGNVILGAGTKLGSSFLQVGVANRFTLEENFSISTGNFPNSSGASQVFTSRSVDIGNRGWLSLTGFAQLTASVSGGFLLSDPDGTTTSSIPPSSCTLLVSTSVVDPTTGVGATIDSSPHKIALSRQGTAFVCSLPIASVIPMMFTNRPATTRLVVKISVSAQLFNESGAPYATVNGNASSATFSGRLFWVENPI